MSRAWVVVAAAALVVTSGCAVRTSPSRSGYESDAEGAVADVLSSVATVRVVLQQEQRRRVLGTSLGITVQDADEAIGSAVAGLDQIDPPSGSDALAAHVDHVLGDAQSVVKEVRVASGRGDRGRYATLVRELRALEKSLDELDGRLR